MREKSQTGETGQEWKVGYANARRICLAMMLDVASSSENL